MHKTPPDYSEIVNPESDDIVLGWDTSAGKMARVQIGNIVTSRLKYMGLCDASTAAYPASPLAGYVYIISVAGTIGEVEYEINDWIMYDGTAWRKIGSGGNANEIAGKAVEDGAPSNGQTFIFNSETDQWEFEEVTAGGGSMTLSQTSFYVDGALAVSENVSKSFVVPVACSIAKVLIACSGTAGSTIVDVNKNGTTIFTTQSNRPELAYDSNYAESGAPDITSLSIGDILSIAIDQIAADASDLTVVILFQIDNFAGATFQIDQSGGTGDTGGILSGSIDGSNAVFTTSLGKYISGSLQVWLNGQLQTQGSSEDWVETDQASGTFTFNSAPESGDAITAAYYQTASTPFGNADTLDGYHADAFAEADHAHIKDDITDLETITETPTANAIVKAGSDGKINDGWLSVKPANENLILNGDFQVWQSGTSKSMTGYDRFPDMCYTTAAGAVPVGTISQQKFTNGQTDVLGNPENYIRLTTTDLTGVTAFEFDIKKEDARSFAGEDATVSFYAKAGSPITIPVGLTKYFGSGGSGYDGMSVGSSALTTSWQKFAYHVTPPSISGKTIGPGSWLKLVFSIPVTSTFVVDIARIKIEAGSIATEGPIPDCQDTLDKCKRYYQHSYSAGKFPGDATLGIAVPWVTGVTTTLIAGKMFEKEMRVVPSVTIYSPSGAQGKVRNAAGADVGSNAIGSGLSTKGMTSVSDASAAYSTTTLYYYHYVADARL